MSTRFFTVTSKFVIGLTLALVCALVSGDVLYASGKTETITIGGTGCALGGVHAVAKAFEKTHPGIRIKIVPSLGSGGGIKAVLAGSLDLALSARPLSGIERSQGAEAIEYARTPFVFVNASKAEDVALSLQQVASVYSGERQRWPDGTPIRLVLRPETDTDTLFLKAMSPAMEKAVQQALKRQGMLEAVTDQDNADLLVKIRGAFGASTYAQILSENRPLRPLSLDGVRPSLETLASGAYPFYKTFYAVTRHGSSSPATRRFIEYLESPEGRAILTRTGHLVAPVSK